MTLSEWIQKHAKTPILGVVILALGIQVLYFCFLGYNRYNEQLEKIELLRESISLGVQQSNRPLIESAMMTSLSNPYISAVLLCADHEAQMLYPADSRNYCKDTGATIKTWPIKRRIIGSQDINLVVILSPVVAFTPLVFLVSVSFVMAGAIFWLLIRVRKRFEAEILNPISEGLNADIPLGVKELEELRFKIVERARLEREKAHLAAMFDLSAQVAHDIRSPLVALDAALNHTEQLPEKQRVIVRHAVNRIRDIANNLLEKNRLQAGTAAAATAAGEPPSVHLLSSLIDPVITEKRLSFESNPGINIDFKLPSEAYGLFASIQPVEFRRMLSNLVNNSVEALGVKGAVEVRLAHEDKTIVLTVSDNGKGIPPEILAKLGQRGETHGKSGGSGLGLFHARTTAESWGGGLTIASTPGKGTTVTVRLPQAQPTAGFVAALKLAPGRPVIVLDDDLSIHELWRGRFETARVKENNIEDFYFSEPGGLRAWVKGNPEQAPKALYLFDYDLAGHTETGLSLAEELNLCNRTILITGRAEEKRIIDACAAFKVRIIPKGLAGIVPISIGSDKPPARAVLLDDSTITQMTWEMAADEAGVKLAGYTEPDKFMADLGTFPKDMPIYIDSELGENVKGENIAAELKDKGFTNICLATAHPPERFAHLPWLKVRSKEAPWGIDDGAV